MTQLLTETGKFKIKASSTLQSSFAAKVTFKHCLQALTNSNRSDRLFVSSYRICLMETWIHAGIRDKALLNP